MNSFAHIFIGKEFEQIVSEIGRVTYKYGNSAVSYLNYYLFDIESSEPSLKKLNISSSATDPNLTASDKYLHTDWSVENISNKSLTEIYRQNIFNTILGGVNRGNQNCLYVCLHFPFYKKSAFEKLTALYQAMRAAQAPDKISLIGYCEDLATLLEGQHSAGTDIIPIKEQPEAYKQFRKQCNTPLEHRLTLFQNTFQNGMPLNMDSHSLAEVIAQLISTYIDYFDYLYPNTMEITDLTSFGIASISLDKYKFVEYLLQKTILHEMDKSSIMNDDVSINDVFDKVRVLLHNKHIVLSNYLNKIESRKIEEWNIVDAEQFIDHEVELILSKCEEIFLANKSMPMRTALLSALLQTNCELFNQMVFDPNSPDINDLYVEAIDYFISHDKTHLLWENEDTPLENPIKEIKSLSLQILNSEAQIKELKKKLSSYEEEIDKSRIIDTVTPLKGDGFFRISEEQQYRLLPNKNEEPLKDAYQPHDVKATSLDLRSNFAPVKDQGQQGSCLAFALTSIFEYTMRVANHRGEQDLSERFLYYNARRMDSSITDPNQDTGLSFKPAIDTLMQYGIATEDLCKYSPEVHNEAPTQEAYNDAKKRLLRKALSVPHSVSAIKSALEDGYPVAASFVLSQTFAKIQQGFISLPDESEIAAAQESDSNHAMVIVGFEDRLQCFLVRNSWGTGWGDFGYCYIPYAYVENKNLFNYACILTEIESVPTTVIQHREIPTLKLNDENLTVRYHTTLAALTSEQKLLDATKAKRLVFSKRFETLKHTLSNHNKCENYIQQTCERTREEQETLKENVKREQLLQDQEYDEYNNIKKRLIFKSIAWPAGILIVVWLWNRLIHALSAKGWFIDFMRGVNWLFQTIKDWLIDAYNFLLAAEPISSDPVNINFSIDWVHYVIIAILVANYLYQGHKHWRIWRDSRDEHEEQIRLLKKDIAAKQKEIDTFRFKTQVVCKWIGALEHLHSKFQHLYSNITSRINNLRLWYVELTEVTEDINLDSAVPNTSVLCKDILDKFCTDHLQHKEEFTIDFADDIDGHEISEEYLNSYQTELQNKVMLQLLSEPCLQDFDMSCHIAADKFTNIAKPVTASVESQSVSAENVKRQSDIFMHIRSVQRGVIMPSTYVFAPSCQQYEHQLRKKIGRGMDTYLTSSDNYRITMLQTINLHFDECVMFQ